MMDPVILAELVTEQEAFKIQCPHCHHEELLGIRDVASSQHSLQRACACGATFTVRLVGFRKAPRKSVKLPASFTALADKRRAAIVCEVVDISVGGMRFVTDPDTSLAVGDKLSIILLLDDEHRTRLHLQGTVKRMAPAEGRVAVAVELIPPKDREREVLQNYMTT